MEKIPRLTPDQRENLVAYLDGELPEPVVREIDQVLSKSPAVRHDVEMLSRTWDLLDQLPRLSTTEDFTARTLAVARNEETPKPLLPPKLTQRLQELPLRRGGIVLAWLMVVGASAFAGYTVTSRWVPDQSDELLRNFPVIEKLDLYRNAESIEFLKQLEQKIGSFDARPTTKP
jgi:anti-sigma factor RsiW